MLQLYIYFSLYPPPGKLVEVNNAKIHVYGNGHGITEFGWREMLSNYISQIPNGKYKYLDSGHYLHNEEPDLIAEMKAFIGTVVND